MLNVKSIEFAIALTCATLAAPYTELVPNFNRTNSNCMVRKIDVPTMANLDYAAYNANPVLYDPQQVKPKKPVKPLTLDSLTFNGNLTNVKNCVDSTPLTSDEKEHPLAWRPLTKKLWEVVKDQGFQNLSSAINGYKWADESVYQAYQDLCTAYLHKVGDSTQLWVKIEFSPWVNFLPAQVKDQDKDGFKEIYGRLVLKGISSDSLQKAYVWVRESYTTEILTHDKQVDWITDLASYWYPTKNTDIIDMTGQDTWPNALTKKVALKTLKGLKVKNPLAVVEGKPISPDKPIYNVYVVDEKDPLSPQVAQVPLSVASPLTGGQVDKVVSVNFKNNEARFADETKLYGNYPAWAQKNAPFMDSLKTMINKLPAQQMGFIGKDDWVFFRKSVDYVLGGDLSNQAADKNPVPHLVDFQKYLTAHNVNMLFVVVPNKEEVYFDKLPTPVPSPAVPIINPYSRKILKDFQAAGIEVIDLLPQFLKAKEEDKNYKEGVYQHQDTHWTNRGLQIAAECIAARIKEYSWYKDLPKVKYAIVDTTFSRQGDIVDKLPEAQRLQFPPVLLNAKQVRMEGDVLYKGNSTSPVMLIGDSFTGVFESVDCKSAGVGANIAAKTGIPVDIITSWGGGPLVRAKAMRAREKDLPYKRLVVYLMVARDLYNYSQLWEPFPAK